VSIGVARKEGLAEAVEVWEAVRRCEAELGEDGRVVVRASGTESLVRVMVEAPTEAEADSIAARLVGVVQRELGAADTL